MRRIEFIGGPAVGKSTVLNEVIKMRSPDESWITVEETKIHLAKTIELDKKKLQRLMQIYLKQNVLKKYRYSMASNILNCYRNSVLVRMNEKYSDIADLFMNRIIKSDRINSLHKMGLTSFYFNLLLF